MKCVTELEAPPAEVKMPSSGNFTRFAAIIVALAIAGGLIYYLLEIKPKQKQAKTDKTIAEKNVEVKEIPAAPETKEPDKTEPEKDKTPPEQFRQPRIIRKTFYRDSAPEDMKPQWESVKRDLATDPAFKNSGALCYELPDKCQLTFKLKSDIIATVDSRLQKSGNFYRKSGDIITIELKRNSWEKPIVIMWTPAIGKADTLRPSSTIFDPTENSHE